MAKMSKDEQIKFGEDIKNLRMRRGVSIKHVATETQIPYSRMRQIEAGSAGAVGDETRKKIESYFADRVTATNIQIGKHGCIRTGEGSPISDDISRESLLEIAKILLSDGFIDKVETIKKTLTLSFDDALVMCIDAMKKKGEFDLNSEKVER